MKVLRKHQVPYRGLDWDHPLRRAWREDEGPDPITGVHAWLYALRSAALYFLAAVAVLAATICLPAALVLMFGTGPFPFDKFQHIAGVLGVCFLPASAVFLLIMAAEYQSEIKESKARFDQQLEELTASLRIETHISTPSWADLKMVAGVVLSSNALNVVLSEVKSEHPYAPDRVQAKGAFEKNYQTFLRWRLIEDTGYGKYFRRVAGFA